MKLDKIKFAMVVGFIQRQFAITLNSNEVAELDNIIDVEVPEQAQEPIYPKNEDVEALMKLMVEGTRKIDAIRYHRAVTGMALKESKEVVERHWFTKWTGEELFVRLTKSGYDANARATIEHFLAGL